MPSALAAIEIEETRDSLFDVPVADNIPHAPSGVAFAINVANLPVEGGTDPTFGTVTWRTLINGSAQSQKEFVLGVAEFGPHGTLHPHRHAPAEFYFGLSGSGTVTIDGLAHIIAPGTAIYVPGNAEHSVVANETGLRFTYGFAEPCFENIDYRFSSQIPPK
jgi:quercetin dioxygenase-like cupin family protein